MNTKTERARKESMAAPSLEYTRDVNDGRVVRERFSEVFYVHPKDGTSQIAVKCGDQLMDARTVTYEQLSRSVDLGTISSKGAVK